MDWVLPRKKSSWFEGKLWRYDLNHRRGQTGETCFQIQNWYKDIIIIISNINFQSFEFWGLDKIIFSIHKVHQKIFLLKSLWINCINFECWKRINRNQTTYKLIQWCKEYSLFFGIYQPKHTNSKPPLNKIIVLNQISTEARISITWARIFSWPILFKQKYWILLCIGLGHWGMGGKHAQTCSSAPCCPPCVAPRQGLIGSGPWPCKNHTRFTCYSIISMGFLKRAKYVTQIIYLGQRSRA